MTQRSPYAQIASVHGPMLVNPCDIWVGRALLATGAYAPDQAECLLHHLPPGGVAIEVGAHCGAHTVALAARAGHVHAFEPQRHLHQLLCANLALGGHFNVTTHAFGLDRTQSVAGVPQLDPAHPQNFGGLSLRTDGVIDAADDVIAMTTLDAFDFSPVDLIKIDVEGMEQAVLEGAVATLDRCRPVLYVEADRADRTPALLGFLVAHGYRPFWHISPLVERGRCREVFGRLVVSFDLLCLPEGNVDGRTWPDPGQLLPALPGDTHEKAMERMRQA